MIHESKKTFHSISKRRAGRRLRGAWSCRVLARRPEGTNFFNMNTKSTRLIALVAGLLVFPARANDIEPGKETYTALRAVNTIVIDGNLSEWTGANVLADPRFSVPKGSGDNGRLVNFETFAGGTWTGPDDQTSSVRVVYDDENVYFGFIVTDDYHEHSAEQSWNGDSVQLMVANGARNTQVGLYNYGLGGVEEALLDTITDHEAGPGGTTAVITRDPLTKKTVYEIKLPKSALELETLAVGVTFGLGMAINDGDDGVGQNGQRGWGGLGAHAIVFGKSPSETALVTLGVGAPSSPCFVSAITTPFKVTSDTFSFRGNDFLGCVVDPVTTTLRIDGQVAALVVSPKVQGATDFTHTLPATFAAGTQHIFSIELRDTNGIVSKQDGIFSIAPPVFPRANLPTGPIAPGLWATRYIFNAGDVDSLVTAVSIIQTIGTANFNGQTVDATSSVLNHGGGGIFMDPVPFDLLAESLGCCLDHFILLSAGNIKINQSGRYTFGVHSEDGFALRIRGATTISSSGDGELDAADPEAAVFRGLTGDSNTRVVYEFPTSGEYRVEFLWFDKEFGQHGELYVAAESYANDSDTSAWQLVGLLNPDGTGVGLAVLETISSVSINGGNIVISFNPADPNPTYKIARSTNLVNWSVLPNAPVFAGGNVVFSVPMTSENSYYRIVK